MYEVELKVRADHDRVRAVLDDRGAERVGRVRQVDTYYDAPHRDFAETDEALRIRREVDLDVVDDPRNEGSGDERTIESVGGAAHHGAAGKGEGAENDGAAVDDGNAEWETTKLTYKGPLVEAASKTREEHETVVSDDEELSGILDGLGFTPAATVRKDREFFRVGDYTVTLDHVDGLGAFCEVEAEAAEADVAPVREGAVELLATVGLDADDQIRTSYLGLLLDAGAGAAGLEDN